MVHLNLCFSNHDYLLCCKLFSMELHSTEEKKKKNPYLKCWWHIFFNGDTASGKKASTRLYRVNFSKPRTIETFWINTYYCISNHLIRPRSVRERQRKEGFARNVGHEQGSTWHQQQHGTHFNLLSHIQWPGVVKLKPPWDRRFNPLPLFAGHRPRCCGASRWVRGVCKRMRASR